MAEFNQFGSARGSQLADTKHCAQFEAMLAEAVDGSLPAEEQAAFELHLLSCAGCSAMLADAQRGAAWMEMLKEHAPEPPASMLEQIFAQTSGAPAMGAGVGAMGGVAPEMLAGGAAGLAGSGLGDVGTGNLLQFRKRAVRGFDFQGLRHTLLQPRLAMTAAMAFFSLALTLNLTGVRVSELRMSDLRPSSLKRSMYEANAHVVRYYTNLRVVYELESRVHDLQRSSDSDGPSSPANVPESGAGTAAPEKSDPVTGDPVTGDPGTGSPGNRSTDKRQRQRVSPGTSRNKPTHQERSVLAGLQGGGVRHFESAGAAMLPAPIWIDSLEGGRV